MTNSVTGEPVNRVLVTLLLVSGERRAAHQGQPSAQVLTDASGTFAFSDLVGGAYRVSATKPQFQGGDGGNSLVLGPSQQNLELKIHPLSTIEGTVLDLSGQPIPGANIQAVRAEVSQGRRTLSQTRSVATDDRGHYRLWNIVPGEYLIRLAGRMGGTRPFLGDNAPIVDWPEAVAPIYYGRATERASATPVVIKYGEHVTADFKEPLRAAFKIRGTLTNYTPHDKIVVELLSPDGQVVSARISVNAVNGKFVVNDVTSGVYLLRAFQGEAPAQLQAETEITVNSGPVDGIELPLQLGADVPVSSRCEDDGRGSGLRACGAEVALISSGQSHRRQGTHMRDGRASIQNVPPGEYTLQAEPFSGYVQSASMGATPLTASTKIAIRAGQKPEPIELLIRSDGGRVEGSFEANAHPTTVAVLAVPGFDTVSGPSITYCGPDGRFDLGPLAPGDYTLYAIADIEQVAYQDTDVRRGFANGVTVRVTSSGTAQVKVTGLAR